MSTRKPLKGKHIALIVLATVMTCAFVWVRLQIVSISYDINELAKQEKTIREECNNLILRINEARSPRRLEHLATSKFDMAAPHAGQVILMNDKDL